MDVFSALADETRRDILMLLAKQGMLSASDIYNHFQSTPSAISQHLKTLRQTNLVLVERSGQRKLYTVNMDALGKIQEWVDEINDIWRQRFKRLEKLLRKHS